MLVFGFVERQIASIASLDRRGILQRCRHTGVPSRREVVHGGNRFLDVATFENERPEIPRMIVEVSLVVGPHPLV